MSYPSFLAGVLSTLLVVGLGRITYVILRGETSPPPLHKTLTEALRMNDEALRIMESNNVRLKALNERIQAENAAFENRRTN
jgi:hypothetical protein